ncbi:MULTISPECIES: MerR family transcriptional regulator [Streptomyces]|uniref:MerR family transcriptional regulator n=1 Tax=Streptomyces lycii TaxID=2654337 RepID=A0ABQ7FNL3_9ACTN|nr:MULTISPECIES: MerR family transcriptional regulator [Streptomyces]KAF4408833.1 MerR family transcriptional regulator [Streptomyces lycii]PGH47096.1 MerR family transcriptional regulator [Streptomyces sp. Ru87]
MLIGELSRRTGVSSRLLRYYESQGLLEAGRCPNGYRDYGEDSVVTVRRIRTLLAAGLTTEVIRQLLPYTRGDGTEVDLCAELRALLDQELAATEARIIDLQRSRSALVGYLSQT